MKIPKPRKRGESYRIELMLDGKRVSATRDTAKECEQWAAIKILEYKTRSTQNDNVKLHYPVSVLFDRYFNEIGSKKESASYISGQIKRFCRDYHDFANQNIHDITPLMITKWRNNRLKQVTTSTVYREMGLYAAIFTYAQKELFLLDTNPFSAVQKPQQATARDRKISNEEIDQILIAFEYTRGQVPSEPCHYVAWCFLFAIETAMRRGEILSITRKNIKLDADYIYLPKTKTDQKTNTEGAPSAANR